MKSLLLLILTVSLASAALANDAPSVYGFGGTIKRMDGEDANVRMESEWVNVDVYDNSYDVSATFNFVNDSDEEQTVMMGFPEYGADGADYYIIGFTSFISTVDGTPVKIRRMLPSKENEDDTRYRAYYVKEVTFLSGQKRLVKVNYTLPAQSQRYERSIPRI